MSTAVAEKSVDQLPVAAPAGSSPVMAMLSDAIQRGMSIDVIREIKAMAVEFDQANKRAAFDRAVADAKSAIPPIKKNRRVGFESRKPGAARTDYAYEDFAEVARTVSPHLAAVGLSYRFRSAQEGTEVRVTCILAHRDGHSEETTLIAAADSSGNKNTIQAVGSTVTYLQRYTLKMALGLAADTDDDGATSEGDTLTEDQVEELKGLIDRAVDAKPNTDPAEWLTTFLEFMKVPSLNAIKVKDFGKGKAAIENAIKQAGKK